MRTQGTPKQGHEPITMRRRESVSAFEQRGDFTWKTREGDKRALIIAIPVPGEGRFVPCEWSIGYKNAAGAQWSWDGNEDLPTLTPSLHWVGMWHGYVRQGTLVEA